MPDTFTPTPIHAAIVGDATDTPTPSTRRIPAEVIAGAKAKIADAATVLGAYLDRVDGDRRKHMRHISPRDSDSIHRAEAIARANPKFRPGFLVIDDFTASLDNMDDLNDLRDLLAGLLASVDDTIFVEENAASKSASAVYKVIQVAAAMNDPDAQLAEVDLASRMIKRGRAAKPKTPAVTPPAPAPAPAPSATPAAASRLALPRPGNGNPDDSRD